MGKIKNAGLQTYWIHSRTDFFICCLTILLSVFLTACGTDTPTTSLEENISGTGASNAESNAGESSPSGTEKEPEWVYVPERIEIADKGAYYDGM